MRVTVEGRTLKGVQGRRWSLSSRVSIGRLPLALPTVTVPLPRYAQADATFSDVRRFRYWLERRWDESLPQFTYILLNPSVAGRIDGDDRVVPKLARMTAANGGGGYELVNLFATVDTKQVGLHEPLATGGRTNDEWIARVVERSTTLVLGWGDGNKDTVETRGRQAAVRDRARVVWPLLQNTGRWCFDRIGSGAPHHPLYLADETAPVPYQPPTGYP